MFREMRRKKQALSLEESVAILNNGTSGVLAVSGDNGYPYAVPLTYVCHENKIFFHCTKTGHKLDALSRNEKASFCVIDSEEIVPEKFTTRYRSVIVFGKARILDDEAEKREALELLAIRCSPNEQSRLQEINKFFDQTCVIELNIDHLTGKTAAILLQEKEG